MGLYYQAEYRIGRRGGRVSREYAGFRAFLAILFDLVFGLLFDVLAAVFTLVTRSLILSVRLTVELLTFTWKMLIFVMTALVHVLALPHRVMHGRFDSPRGRRWPDPISTPRGRVMKPEWALGREV